MYFLTLAIIPHRVFAAFEIPEITLLIDKPYNQIFCSCITYLKSLGKTVSGDAWNLQPNTGIHEGAIALFHYSNRLGHAALVTKIENEGFFISEVNFRKCAYTERFIKWNYYALYGFYESNYKGEFYQQF